MRIRKIVIVLSIVGVLSAAGSPLLPPVLTGPTAVTAGQIRSYTFDNGSIVLGASWSAGIKGTIVSYAQSGTTYTADVFWTQSGSATVYFQDGDDFSLGTLAVTVSASTTPVPSTTFSITYNCGNTVITRNSNPASGYEWYWQILSNGIETYWGNSPSITISSTKNVYLRTKATTSIPTWSTTLTQVGTTPVNVTSATTANAGPDQTGSATCGLTQVTLAANSPSIGTGSWSVVSGTGGSFGTPSSPTSIFSGTAGSAYTLRWTISNSPCIATDDVAITFNRNPTTANAGSDQTGSTTCNLTQVTLAGNAPSIGTGNWSVVSGTGGSFGTPSSPTSTFNGLAGSTYTLRWTISSPCTASTDDVAITFNRNPTTANAGPDQTGSATCGLTQVTLAANSPSVGTGSWSVVSGTGGSFGTSSSPTSTFSGIVGSAYIIRWTISNSPCTASTDDVAITFNSNPTTANAGPDQTGSAMCGLTQVTLAANSPSIGTGSWSVVSGTGGSFGTPSSPTSTFSGTAGSAYTLRWTISNSPCIATDDVAITFNRNPTTANAGSDQMGSSTCGLTVVTLAGNTPAVGTGSWSVVSGSGGGITNPSSPTSSFTGISGNDYVLRWSIANGICQYTDDVSINLTRKPDVSATAGYTMFTGGTTSISISNPNNLAGTTFSWTTQQENVTGASPGSSNNISQQLQHNGQTTSNGAATYTITPATSICTGIPVTVTMNVVPSPVVTTSQARLMPGVPVVLTVTSAFSTYQWNDFEGGVVGTSQSVNVLSSGDYRVTVTQSGSVGTGTSQPFHVYGQFEGENLNYVLTSTALSEGITNATLKNQDISKVGQTIQYFDGQGRPTQLVTTQGSPSKKDLIQPIAYDQFGREVVKYLPYTGTGADGWFKDAAISEQASFYAPPGNGLIAPDLYPVSVTVVEATPLNRVLKQGTPGLVWQPNSDANSMTDKTIKMRYEFNGMSDVLLWTYNSQTNKASAKDSNGVLQYYTVNQLYANKTYDEANHVVIEYVDKQGRTILKRVQADDTVTPTYANTYYIYDDFGNLVIVLPPEAVKALTN